MIIELAQRVVSVEPELMGQFFDVDSTVTPAAPRPPSSWRPRQGLFAPMAAGRTSGATIRSGCTMTFVLPQSMVRLEANDRKS